MVNIFKMLNVNFYINLYKNSQYKVQINLLNEIGKCRGGWCMTENLKGSYFKVNVFLLNNFN